MMWNPLAFITRQPTVAEAARTLTDHGKHIERARIRQTTAALRCDVAEGRISPIAPREVVVAGVAR